MRSVLCKWTPRDKYFKYRNFPTSFRLSLTLNVLAKFNENRSNLYTLWNHSKWLYPPLTRATPGDYFIPGNRKPMGQGDLLASITMDQDFPRKVTNWRHFFSLILITHWTVEKDDTIMGKVAWGKGKTRVKAGTCISKRRTSFLTLYAAKFGSTATSLFEIWMPAWSSTDTARFHRGLFFSFRDWMVLLLSSLDLFLILSFFY